MSTSTNHQAHMPPGSSSSASHADSERTEPETISTVDGGPKGVKKIADGNLGFLLVVGSQALFAMGNIAAKQLSNIDPPISVLELVWVRVTISYLFSVGLMLRSNIEHPFFGPPGVRILLAFCGLSGCLDLFGIYLSLQHLSVSDATVINFLTPLCTALAGSLFLGETFTRKMAFAGFVSLLGVVLIARPTFLFGHESSGQNSPANAAFWGTPKETSATFTEPTNQRDIAVVFAMVGVLGSAGAYTFTRAIGKRAHPLHCLMYYCIPSLLLSTVGIIVRKTPVFVPIEVEWAVLLGFIGVLGFTGAWLKNMGLQRETAGRCSMAIYTQIIFATSMEAIFFHVVPTALSVVGTVMILGSGIWVVLSKSQEAPNQATAHPIEDEELERGLLEEDEDDLTAGHPRI